MKTLSLIAILIVICTAKIYSQENDSLCLDQKKTDRTHRFRYTQLIAPVALTTVGIVGLKNNWLINQETNIRDGLQRHINRKKTFDDYVQYAPFVAVYGLNLCGLKGKHNLRDRTIILGISYMLMGASVNITKATTRRMRPDGSSANSFPSGHTATAFMGAEFLWQEYRDVSPWIGVGGYVVATGTGFFRMYNNRHWLTDVLAGAGIGILSTKVAYWVYPTIQKALFQNRYKDRKKRDGALVVMPYYNPRSIGVGASAVF